MRSLLSGICLLFLLNAASAQRPITPEEAQAVAQWIETATNSGNANVLNHFIDVDTLLARVGQKSEVMQDPEFRRGFSESFAKSFTNYGTKIVASIQKGNYRLLHEYESGGDRHLLFRMFGSGGLNYHDYTLIRVKDSIKAADVRLYSTDELMSVTLSRLTDMMSPGKSQDEADAFVHISSENNQQHYAAVKEIYDKTDEKIRNNKTIQLIYISACHHIDSKSYQDALEHFSQLYPDAAPAYLLMIDLYLLQKNYEKGLAAIDKIDKLVNEDKVLDYFRGNYYRAAGKPAESIACLERVYHYDPTISLTAHLLVRSYEEEGEKAKAKKVMDDFKKSNAFHAAEFSDLAGLYPDLK